MIPNNTKFLSFFRFDEIQVCFKNYYICVQYNLKIDFAETNLAFLFTILNLSGFREENALALT